MGPPPPGPGSIAIEPEALSFSWVGESRRLLAQVRDEAGVVLAFPAVSWSSTNPSAVTVSPGGFGGRRGRGSGDHHRFVGSGDRVRECHREPGPGLDAHGLGRRPARHGRIAAP